MPRATLLADESLSFGIALEPILATQLSVIAKLSNKSLNQVCNDCLSEWMSTTGDLVIDCAAQVTAQPKRNNLLTFTPAEERDRKASLKTSHKHRSY